MRKGVRKILLTFGVTITLTFGVVAALSYAATPAHAGCYQRLNSCR